jgi:hypothetical protein
VRKDDLGMMSAEQKTKNEEQRTKNKEQRTKNKEQRTRNKEQRTKNKEPALSLSKGRTKKHSYLNLRQFFP